MIKYELRYLPTYVIGIVISLRLHYAVGNLTYRAVSVVHTRMIPALRTSSIWTHRWASLRPLRNLQLTSSLLCDQQSFLFGCMAISDLVLRRIKLKTVNLEELCTNDYGNVYLRPFVSNDTPVIFDDNKNVWSLCHGRWNDNRILYYVF